MGGLITGVHLCHLLSYCFFFQAEDGIRDIGVTGVQTCALPISTRVADFGKWTTRDAIAALQLGAIWTPTRRGANRPALEPSEPHHEKIGRASCRERV